MKRLLLLLALTNLAFGEELSLQFSRIDLSDGRTLKNVAIKTFDPSTNRVLLVADGKASMVPLSAFPAPVDKQISSTAPRSGSSTMVAPVPPAPKAPPAPQYVPTPSTDNADAAKLQREVYKHAETARAKANRYFRYQYNVGSGAVRVRSVDIDATDPEPISGWSGRFRTQGRANIEFFDSRGWSYSRATATYEVLTETKADGQVIASDLTVKSTAR